MKSDFNNADFYGGDADERLSFEDADEYALDYFERSVLSDEPEAIEAALQDAHIEVWAYHRRVVALSDIRGWAVMAAESISECYGDEYGDWENGDDFDDEALARSIEASIIRILRDETVFRCERGPKRVYGEDELRKLYTADMDNDAEV